MPERALHGCILNRGRVSAFIKALCCRSRCGTLHGAVRIVTATATYGSTHQVRVSDLCRGRCRRILGREADRNDMAVAKVLGMRGARTRGHNTILNAEIHRDSIFYQYDSLTYGLQGHPPLSASQGTFIGELQHSRWSRLSGAPGDSWIRRLVSPIGAACRDRGRCSQGLVCQLSSRCSSPIHGGTSKPK
jgi:hypothetical protein